MQVFSVVMVVLFAVLVSSFLHRASRFPVPLPLMQILVGALLAAFSPFRVELNPQVFFLLFLPPLLFLDGWRIPKTGLFRDVGTILDLSIGLVVFTVIGLAFFITWIIPTIPLSAAFALAAVLAPTDPVAFAAIAAKHPIPPRVMHILEGESLLNDASALVFFRFAIAAALTGTFSFWGGVGTFAQLALGGLGVGVGVSLLINFIKGWSSKRYGEDPGVQILISLLIPFAAYMTAEHLHCSGILAAVAAGVTMSYMELTGQASAITRIRRNAVWDTAQYTLNGFIFVILGQQLPSIFLKTAKSVSAAQGLPSLGMLGLHVLVITLGLFVLRFVWVWFSLHVTIFRQNLTTSGGASKAVRPSLRLISAMTLAGVRGAISLAAILTLPLTLNNGDPFPGRDLMIFIAAGVIVTTLLTVTLALPKVLAGMPSLPEPSKEKDEDSARQKATAAAIREIERLQHKLAENRDDADLYTEAASRTMEFYRLRIRTTIRPATETHQSRKIDDLEKQLRLAGLKAERAELYRMARAKQIGEDLARKLVREIDLIEARYV